LFLGFGRMTAVNSAEKDVKFAYLSVSKYIWV
jgi:hypothetical protein